jgi:hypothetical protein
MNTFILADAFEITSGLSTHLRNQSRPTVVEADGGTIRASSSAFQNVEDSPSK